MDSTSIAMENQSSGEGQPKPKKQHGRNRISEFLGDDGGREGTARAKCLPAIDAGSRDAPRISELAWKSLQASNRPERLFSFGGSPVRIGKDEAGAVSIQHLDERRFRHVLCRAARWYKRMEKADSVKDCPAMPSKDIVQDMLAAPEIPLPPLRQVVESPVFASNGGLKTTPGYNRDCLSYYAPAKGFRVPAVSHDPSDEDIDEARSLICDELLVDFPFVGEAEKAHAVALTLQPFARNLIDGCTPLYVIEKPTPGTGATKMVESITWLSLGREIESRTEASTEEEWRKKITSALSLAPAYFFIDNLSQPLASGHLSSALTTRAWSDRLLGVTKDISVKPHCTWIATGNNPSYSDEMTRRIIRIRLDARVDRPHLREQASFKHHLPDWAKVNRPQLVWAALTLIQAWVAAGRPKGGRNLGMFEQWSEVMGGILDVINVPGFLMNQDEMYAASNGERAAWATFVGLWWDEHKERFVKGGQIYPLVARHDIPLDLGDKGDQSRKIKLGDLIKLHRDQVFTIETGSDTVRLKLERSTKQTNRTYDYRLVRLGAQAGGCV